jgi:outer membrane protein assembly factor BamB
VALLHSGEVVWQRSFVKDYGEIKGPHGYASSPILVDGKLVVQVCHSGASYLLALEAKTGANQWKIDHPSQTGWSSPASYQHDKSAAIVVSTAGSVRAYDAANGKEIWHVTGVQGNSTASPTIAGDLVVIGASERGGGSRRGGGGREAITRDGKSQDSTPEQEANRSVAANSENAAPGSLVIRLGGQGDITQTHVVWRSPKATTGYSSPLVYEGMIYFTNKVGVVQCVDLKSGEVKGQHRLPGQMWASAVANNGYLYFFCKEGEAIVLKAGPELHPAAENTISVTDVIYGVAAVDNAWLARSGRSLVKIVASPHGAEPQNK